MVVHTYHPSYAKEIGRKEDGDLKPAPGKHIRPYCEISKAEKGWQSVSSGRAPA
jgi:hypothetical protein